MSGASFRDGAPPDEQLAALVHELRTPVTTIRALAELMLDAGDMDPVERRGFLSIIASESSRLGRLIDDVLDAARLGSEEADWRIGEVDPLALLRDAAAIARPLLDKKGAGLVLDLPAAAPRLSGDRDRLLQVLLNLLSNAAHAVPERGGRVTMSLELAPDALTIRVSDNGSGIPPEDREAVFQPFRRFGAAGERATGTGLGLPISRGIVEHHGGCIRVEPSQTGACVAVHLPITEPAP